MQTPDAATNVAIGARDISSADDDEPIARGSWLSLPTELRSMVLDQVIAERHPGWSSAAAVCTEWQRHLARANLHTLTVSQSAIEGLGSTMRLQVPLIRRVILDVDLPRYNCGYCGRRGPPRDISHESEIVMAALQSIVSVLRRDRGWHGITLEVNAHSESDWGHFFKELHFSARQRYSASAPPPDLVWHDETHGWQNGRRVQKPPMSALFALFEPLPLSEPADRSTSAVTRIVIRRRMRRPLYWGDLSGILSMFVGLEEIHYEAHRPWVEEWTPDPSSREGIFKELRELCPTVRRFTYFEDSNDCMVSALLAMNYGNVDDPDNVDDPGVTGIREPSEDLGQVVAVKSMDLEHLSTAYNVNARDVFRCCIRNAEYAWPHLQTLVLTDMSLDQASDENDHGKTMALLIDAARVVRRMPKLQRLVIWNGNWNNACMFEYAHCQEDSARLLWRSTWPLELDSALEQWTITACQHHDRTRLSSVSETIDAPITNDGDVIHHLGLRDIVLLSESVDEIRAEAQYLLIRRPA